jgi:hypothetical protein
MKEDVLNGKTIITTRPAGKADALARQLTYFGATVYNLPTIEIQPVRYNNNKRICQLYPFKRLSNHPAQTGGQENSEPNR